MPCFDDAGAIRRLSALPPPLLAWYDAAARPLPWRLEPSPYRVWISEMMLQQTRMEAALPYFERFVAELPDAAALAAAGESRLMKLWEGLGYYSRARNLQKAAKLVLSQHGGELPADYHALRALPGLGDYSAGAVASIAFGIRVPAVDGNVLRVVSRLLDSDAPVTDAAVKKRLTALLAKALPIQRVGDFNQSLMELGATICLPNGAPRCGSCPVFSLCLGQARGRAAQLPKKMPKKARRMQQITLLCLTNTTGIFIRRRPERGLLASLWEVPSADGSLDGEQAIRTAREWGFSPVDAVRLSDCRHVFTHVEWNMTVWRLHCADGSVPDGWVCADGAALREQYPLPSAFSAAIAQLSL